MIVSSVRPTNNPTTMKHIENNARNRRLAYDAGIE